MIKVLKRKTNSLIFSRTSIGEILNGLYDIHHHLKYSFKERNLGSDQLHLQFYLTKHYHIIEKGLALPKPRKGFGQPKILDLIEKSITYQSLYGEDKLIRSIKKALVDYLELHKNELDSFPENFISSIYSFINKDHEDLKKNTLYEGGLKHKASNTACNLTLKDFTTFVESRASVRDFSDADVPFELLNTIINASQSAPSVCNRQAWKVHCYSKKSTILEILSHQNGNIGFREKVNKLIIVTSDAKGFTKNESNQLFIDGGLFSQNILLGVHAAGLGACPLNTCYTFRQERNVKSLAGIPDNERLIMMIAVGCLKDQYSVAYSARNPVENIMVTH